MPTSPPSPRPPRKATPAAVTPRASGANFRVLLGDEEVGVLSVSSPHLLDPAGVESRGGGAGASPNHPRPLPPTVTLRRAVDGNRAFYSWARLAQGGKPVPRTVALLLLEAPGGEPLHRWELRGARPVRWSGPTLDAMDGELAMEELELAYDTVLWP